LPTDVAFLSTLYPLAAIILLGTGMSLSGNPMRSNSIFNNLFPKNVQVPYPLPSARPNKLPRGKTAFPNCRNALRWQITGSPMSAVAEEKFGSSSVQRKSVPAATKECLAPWCSPAHLKNNTETATYKRNRRMCATSRFEGQAERARNARAGTQN